MLAGAFLFNLGQGVLRPTLPLYLQQVFAASYRMVTLIPVVFAIGKWLASLPTGYLLDRVGRRPLMVGGLLLIALGDVASAATSAYAVFLGLRGLCGAGWAAFSTVATTTAVDHAGSRRRGRAVSLLLMSETLGLLVGSTVGGWLYQGLGAASPFLFEAVCMVVAAVAVSWQDAAGTDGAGVPSRDRPDRDALKTVLHVPGVPLMSAISMALIAIQTGAIVFLFPLFLVEVGRGRVETVGYLVSLAVLGRLLGLWLGGHASDRWGRMPVLTSGLLAYGVAPASLTRVTVPVLLGPWSVTIGAAGGLVAGLPIAVVGDRVRPSLRGVAIGWLRTMSDTGMLLGPLVMGALADAAHLSAPFLFAAGLVWALAWRCRSRRLA